MFPRIIKTKKDFLDPEAIVRGMGLKPGESVIEFGSGPGFWTIPLAKAVTTSGTVYTIDEREENLSIIKNKALKYGIKNIKLYKAPYSSPLVPLKEKADLVLISNVLSISKSWEPLLSSVQKNVKKGSRLVIVDWKEPKLTFGKEHHSWVEEIIIIASKSGFEFKKLVDAGDYHFGLYFVYNGEK